jgi:hypothetical protein
MRQAVMRRFGNTIIAQKKFINLAGAYTLKTGKRRGQKLNYPALVVTVRTF